MPSSSQLSSLLRKILPTSTSSRIRSFSSHPSTTTTTRKRWSCFSDEIPEESETSSVYNHALKFQRPSTIKYGDNSVNNRSLNLQWPSASTYTKQPVNSVSLIGTVVFPLKRVQKPDEFGVHTVLRVQTSPRSKSSFVLVFLIFGCIYEVGLYNICLFFVYLIFEFRCGTGFC
ncbi:hypothetical protein ACH5RR_029882 [Cinchona calisaya]|uniref:Uncharacterized protein n=1 Tax=Cinchona calisaya TaxID=153742 RepID=A0ABD2YUD6_9GENT